jgi:DIM1 family U5 snRNP protein
MLYKISPLVKNHAVVYTVDTKRVTDFNAMYELYDACSVMFFWRNKHIQVDFGTGNNNKINFKIYNKQELIDIIEVAYKAASKGKGLAVSPKDYSTKWRY